MRLFGYWRSSAAYRVRIGLNLKGLAYDQAPRNLVKAEHRDADYAALNPQKLVPTLTTDDGQTLTQSLAILEWLEETHPQPPLLPSDPLARAKVRAMALAVAAEIHPLNNMRIMAYLREDLSASEDAVSAWYKHWIAEGFAALEAMVEPTRPGAPVCFAAAPGLADCCLIPQIYNARRFQVDLTPYPKLMAIEENLQRIEAFREAAPENQPDAPKGA